jgi:hypothetical protein
MQSVSFKSVFVGNLINLALLAGLLAVTFVATVLFGIAFTLLGLGKGPLDTDGVASGMVYGATLVTGYVTGGRASPPVLNAALSVGFLALVGFSHDAIWVGLAAVPKAALESGAMLLAAGCGGYLRNLQSENGIAIAWGQIGRGVLSLFVASGVMLLTFLVLSTYLKGSDLLTVPGLVLGAGTIAAYLCAPAAGRPVVVKAFFVILTVAALVVWTGALASHTARSIHWMVLGWIAGTAIVCRPLWRSAQD